MPSRRLTLLQVSECTADATNSQVDPSDSVQNLANVNNGGRPVHRFLDRFKQSLIGGLLRISGALKEGHNAEADLEENAPDNADTTAAVTGETGIVSKRNLSRAAAAIKNAEKFYTTDSELYNLQSVLDYYQQDDPRILPKSLRYLAIKSRRSGGDRGEANSDSVEDQFVVHPLLDKLVVEFCHRLGMMEAARLPVFQERMFLWLGRDHALRMLAQIGSSGGSRDAVSNEQVYFTNQVNLDRVLTDLQCLVTRLTGCVASEGQSYPAHWCHDVEKIREQHRGPHSRLPKMAFMDRQSMCQHTYLKQDFGLVCEEADCPQRGIRMCACFQENIFIPDTIVLATKQKFEDVRRKLLQNSYGEQQRWLIRAACLKGGNGVQLIDSASQLETFMRYDLRKKLRGQFFVLQRYLKNPQLLDGRRFDLRMFLLASVLTDRRVVAFLHPGYVRVAQRDYEVDSNDLRCHLTCPFAWEPDYTRYGRGTNSTSEDYCRDYTDAHESLGLPAIACGRELDSVLFPTWPPPASTNLEHRFLKRLGHIVQSLVGQIDSIVGDKPGSWQLFGLDLMLDTNKEVWLHDVMTYPGCDEPDARSATQNRILPAVFTESLALVLELNQRDKATRDAGLWLDLPDVPVNQPGVIAAQKNFVWMYSTDAERLIGFKPKRQRTKPPHWYTQWRINEDLNDYILYLKNFRINTFQLEANKIIYGRKCFEHSPAEKIRMHIKTIQEEVESQKKPPPTSENRDVNAEDICE